MLQLIILLAIAALTALDQWFKYLAVVHLKEQPPFVLIDGVFELHYSENTGAAFGILQDHRWVFMSVTIIVMVFLLVLLLSGKFRQYPLLNVSGVLIVAGGIGNLIDRIFNGYVVDFLYFKLINFPIFNFADCCVVIGAVMLLVFFFFFYDEKPLLRHPKAQEAVSAGETTEGSSPAETADIPEGSAGIEVPGDSPETAKTDVLNTPNDGPVPNSSAQGAVMDDGREALDGSGELQRRED